MQLVVITNTSNLPLRYFSVGGDKKDVRSLQANEFCDNLLPSLSQGTFQRSYGAYCAVLLKGGVTWHDEIGSIIAVLLFKWEACQSQDVGKLMLEALPTSGSAALRHRGELSTQCRIETGEENERSLPEASASTGVLGYPKCIRGFVKQTPRDLRRVNLFLVSFI